MSDHCNMTVVYKETLPCDAPPTYRGQLLKYAYKITIGTQRLGSPTKLLRIPIMVIVLQGKSVSLLSHNYLASISPFDNNLIRSTFLLGAPFQMSGMSICSHVP